MNSIPAHVSAEREIDFDIMNDPALAYDIFARLRVIRDGAPAVAYAPASGGWLVFGRKEIEDVLKRAEVFSSSQLGAQAGGVGYIPLSLDPPEHAPWRHLLMKYFGPQQIKALESFVRDYAERLIPPLADQPGCDFIKAVAEPMPVSIFMMMMGLPLDRFDEFRGWVVSGLGGGETEGGVDRRSAHQLIRGALQEVIDDRRREPRDDLISKLLAERIQDREITAPEMMSMCYLLFLAGLDTVTNAMAYGMRHLALDPALQESLRRDRSLIPGAIDRLLRLYTFVNTMRVAKQDAELGGVSIRAGDLMWCVLWAGSNDPDTPPDSLRHLGFGGGHHLCLGMHLARMELRVMYETWFDHIGEATLAPDDRPAMHGGPVMSISRLLLNLAPPQP